MGKKLQVWWIPYIPGESFTMEVVSVREGANVLSALAKYDMYLDPNCCNAGGLHMMGEDGEWEDWYLETEVGGYYEDPEDYIRMVDDDSLLDYLEMREGV